MMRLDSSTTSLKVVLAGAKTTNDAQCYASYYDVPARQKQDFSEYLGAINTQDTNGTTAVTAVAAPQANTIRQVDYFSVHNYDTADVTVIVYIDENATVTRLIRRTLLTNQSLIWSRGAEWQVMTVT